MYLTNKFLLPLLTEPLYLSQDLLPPPLNLLLFNKKNPNLLNLLLLPKKNLLLKKNLLPQKNKLNLLKLLKNIPKLNLLPLLLKEKEEDPRKTLEMLLNIKLNEEK